MHTEQKRSNMQEKKIKCNNTKNDKVQWFYKRKTKERNPNWPTDNTYTVLIIWGTRSGKTNSLCNKLSAKYLYVWHESKRSKISVIH